MSIVLTRNRIRSLVRDLGRIVNGQAKAFPVLGHVRVDADAAGTARFAATDLEESLEVAVPGAAAGRVAPFLIPFEALRRLPRDMTPAATADLAAAGDPQTPVVATTLTDGGRTISRAVASMSADEFPAAFRSVPTAPYPAGRLLEVCAGLFRVASTDPTRNTLSGVLIEAATAVAVATDGRRLCRLPLPGPPFGRDVILPPSRFLRAAAAADGESAAGAVEVDGTTMVELRLGDLRWQGKAVDGLYPNYRQVIPDAGALWDGRFAIAPEDLEFAKAALRQLADRDHVAAGVALLGRRVVLVGHPDDAGVRPAVLLPNSLSVCDLPLAGTVDASFLLDALDLGFTEVRLSRLQCPWRCTRPGEGDDGSERAAVHAVMPMRGDSSEALLGAAVEALSAATGLALNDLRCDIERVGAAERGVDLGAEPVRPEAVDDAGNPPAPAAETEAAPVPPDSPAPTVRSTGTPPDETGPDIPFGPEDIASADSRPAPQPKETKPMSQDENTPAGTAACGTAPDAATPFDAEPAEAFRTAMDEADAAVREAVAKVRAVRIRFRLLERDMRSREKRCLQYEKAISTLQQAAGF